MEKFLVAIVSDDRAYSRTLAASLTDICREMTVECFESRTFIKNWSEHEGSVPYYETFDIVLWAGDEICDSYGDNIIYLTDRISLTGMDYSGKKFCIYKFSTAGSIAAAVFDIYEYLTGRRESAVRKNDVRIFAFSSCCGGTGCSTAVMATGQELSRFRGKRVFYLSMEDVESTENFMNITAGSRTAGEFIYRLMGRSETLAGRGNDAVPFLDGFIVRSLHGVEAFTPARGKNPLRELSSDEMGRLLSALTDSGRYDVILADLSTCLTDAAITVMLRADRICHITKGLEANGREESYMTQVLLCSENKTAEKTIKISAAADKPADSEDGAETVLHISRFRPEDIQGKEILLEGEFGRDICRIAGILMESRLIM